MTREPSWRAVADILADRMYHHSRCDQHPEAEAVPDDCPFCADRAAYRLWQTKGGKVHRERIDRGPTTSIEVLRHARSG